MYIHTLLYIQVIRICYKHAYVHCACVYVCATIHKCYTFWQISMFQETFRSYTKTMILQYPSKLHILQILDHCARLAWSFLASLNRKVMIWWGFFMLTAPAAVSAHVGIDSLKKPHDIISLSFCEVIKDHATCLPQGNR